MDPRAAAPILFPLVPWRARSNQTSSALFLPGTETWGCRWSRWAQTRRTRPARSSLSCRSSRRRSACILALRAAWCSQPWGPGTPTSDRFTRGFIYVSLATELFPLCRSWTGTWRRTAGLRSLSARCAERSFLWRRIWKLITKCIWGRKTLTVTFVGESTSPKVVSIIIWRSRTVMTVLLIAWNVHSREELGTM